MITYNTVFTALLRVYDALRHLLFPRRCVVCGTLAAELDDAHPMCARCLSGWMAARAVRCPDCGAVTMLCRCRAASGIACYSLVPYRPGKKREDPASRLLLSRKERDDTDARRFLAGQMAPLCECAISEHTGDGSRGDWILTYPPRSTKKRRLVGFDQSETLARTLSHLCGIPCCRAFTRVRGQNTEQKQLNAVRRAENAQNSYRLHPALAEDFFAGRRVILIDDIVTTGATLSACAALLYEAGAVDCVAVTAAKTVSQERSHTWQETSASTSEPHRF